MGTKKRRAKKISNGTRRSVRTKTPRDATQRLFDKLEARLEGKKVATLEANLDFDTNRRAPYLRVVR